MLICAEQSAWMEHTCRCGIAKVTARRTNNAAPTTTFIFAARKNYVTLPGPTPAFIAQRCACALMLFVKWGEWGWKVVSC